MVDDTIHNDDNQSHNTYQCRAVGKIEIGDSRWIPIFVHQPQLTTDVHFRRGLPVTNM